MRGVRATPGFWVLLSALWLMDPELLLWLLPAAGCHELGHCIALRALGGRVSALRLTLFGAELRPAVPLSYGRELWVALAGPAASLLFALLAARLGLYLPAGLSLALGLFNLLPVHPLDGGRAFGCLCALILPPPLHQALPRWTGVLTAGGALGLAAALAIRLTDPAPLLPALLLCAHALLFQKNP